MNNNIIIISYCESDDAHIMTSPDGETLTFGTVVEAEAYAKENCAWNYKIVML